MQGTQEDLFNRRILSASAMSVNQELDEVQHSLIA